MISLVVTVRDSFFYVNDELNLMGSLLILMVAVLRSDRLNPISRTKEYRSQLRSRLRENPVIAMAERVSSGISKALLSVGASKTAPTFSLLGFTPEQLKGHIEKQFLPKMTWKNRSEWQIDHITPISSAKSESDVIALNQLFNLRPIWSSENNLKRAKIYFLI